MMQIIFQAWLWTLRRGAVEAARTDISRKQVAAATK
jgi:hypothetical protein